MTPDYDITWNGTLEQQKRAAGLSSYLGPSQLASFQVDDADPFVKRRPRLPMPSKAQVVRLRAKGVGWNTLRDKYRRSIVTLKRIAELS